MNSKYLWLTLATALVAGTAWANPLSKTENEVRLGGDRYLSGQSVQVNDDTTGDVFAIGDSVHLTGAIQGDVLVFARSVTIDGEVTGSVRGAAEIININSSVGAKIMVATLQLHLNSGAAATAGSLIAAAGDVTIDRPLAGYAYIGAQNLTINQRIDGPVRLVNTAVTLGSDVKLPSGVTFQKINNSTANDQSIATLRKIAQVNVVESTNKGQRPSISYVSDITSNLLSAIALVILAGLALWLVPTSLVIIAEAQRSNGWLVVLFGIFGLPVYLLLAIMTFFTLFLAPVGVVMLLMAPILFLLAYIAFLLNVGRLARRTPAGKPTSVYGLIVLGAALIFLLNLIPFFGFVIDLTAFIICSGVWWVLFLRKVRAIK